MRRIFSFDVGSEGFSIGATKKRKLGDKRIYGFLIMLVGNQIRKMIILSLSNLVEQVRTVQFKGIIFLKKQTELHRQERTCRLWLSFYSLNQIDSGKFKYGPSRYGKRIIRLLEMKRLKHLQARLEWGAFRDQNWRFMEIRYG